MQKRVAMISVHECPLASSEGKERGGINVYVYELSKALAKKDWHVDAFTRVQDDVNPRIESVSKNFRVIHLPAGPHTHLKKNKILPFVPEFAANFADFMKKESAPYNVIHSHYYLSGEVVRIINKTRKNKIPWVASFHTMGPMKQLVAQTSSTDDPKERNTIERQIAQQSNALVVSSANEKEYMRAFFDIKPKSMVTIPPGVDTNLFIDINQDTAMKKLGVTHHTHIILAVGRIDPVKGFDTLLIALKILLAKQPQLKKVLSLWIVGGDIEEDKILWNRELTKLEALRRQLTLQTTVKFIPAQHQEVLPLYYNAAEVLVMPSHYESFGMVALEALACGTPVIVTDVTGISPTLKEMDHSHVIGANNPIALSNELEHVLCKPHANKPAASIKKFDWSTIASKMGKLYASL